MGKLRPHLYVRMEELIELVFLMFFCVVDHLRLQWSFFWNSNLTEVKYYHYVHRSEKWLIPLYLHFFLYHFILFLSTCSLFFSSRSIYFLNQIIILEEITKPRNSITILLCGYRSINEGGRLHFNSTVYSPLLYF